MILKASSSEYHGAVFSLIDLWSKWHQRRDVVISKECMHRRRPSYFGGMFQALCDIVFWGFNIMRSVLDTWSSSCLTLYVGNLDSSLTRDDITRIFEQYGTIQEIDIPSNASATASQTRFCFIVFERWESVVLSADNFNGVVIRGRAIRVEPAPKYKK